MILRENVSGDAIPLVRYSSGWTAVPGETNAGIIIIAKLPLVCTLNGIHVCVVELKVLVYGVIARSPVVEHVVVRLERRASRDSLVVHIL